MPSTCFTLVRGRAMRVTRLNACGDPVFGPASTVASEGFISVALTANTEEGETITQTNANGKICISDQPAPTFTGYSVEVQFCNVDPDLYALMTGQAIVLDDSTPAPVTVGFQVNSDVNLDDSGFALELWSGVPGAACGVGGDPQYGYLLIPFLKGGVIGDFTIENAAITFTITGANSKDGTSWGVGPYDVLKETTGAAGPLLEPLPTTNHLHMQLTTLPPPDTDVCGAAALGTEDTTATAGSPSVSDPGTYYPAGMTGVTASPATAWATGEYAQDWTGAKFHWDGTTWSAGVAA
jgi:hypothetical protein